MALEAVIIGVACGSVLIVAGLVPGLFWGLVDGLATGLQNFKSSISSEWPQRPMIRTGTDKPDPVWLVAVGALVITLTLLQYLSS